MDSKHEQIGTRGNTEKKICEITPPHVSEFVRSVRSDGGREREARDRTGGDPGTLRLPPLSSLSP